MRDFEQEPNENFGIDDNQTELPKPNETEDFQEQKEESNRTSDPNYGYLRQNQSDFGSNDSKPPKKSASASLLVAFCLVLFIFIAISIGALLDIGYDGGDLSTSDSTNQSTSSDSTSNFDAQSTTSFETAPGASVVAPGTNEYVSVYRDVATKCIKSVVVIQVKTSTGSGAGSGVIYNPDGYIVTNYHVANETCTDITVILYDGSQYKGTYVYGDELSDLAVVSIEKSNCDYATFGDSSKMTYGDAVVAIGNPLGYGLSVTTGVISRPSETIAINGMPMTLLRTDAAVNSGNSGGGLFNLNGELIGIVNAKIAADTVDNIGYAIPSETVVKNLNDLNTHGYITGRADLGIEVKETIVRVSYREYYVLLQIEKMNPQGSAAESELKVGDILIQCDGKTIDSFSTLSQYLLTKYSVGDKVTLTVRRPTIELTPTNLDEYLRAAEIIDIEITFKDFNPNA